ncbi:MAG: GNAT family N-acetyltransferase, partial [Solirubrobacterales bacterium]
SAMATPTDEELLRRCWDFELAIGEAIAERVEDVGEGFTAVLDTRIPQVWDANYLVVESPAVTAQAVAAKADEVMGDLGMEHRGMGARDPALGARLTEGLVKLGWEAEVDVYQVLRRDPDRPADVEVEQVSVEDAYPVNRAAMLAEDWGTPEVVEQMRKRDGRIAQACHDRWFAAGHEGEPASVCRLMQRDGIGQVEDVATLEPARGQGLARAVVLAAAQASVADGDELTFISALADDWPRRLYERLGFDAVGEVTTARRKPQ